MQALLCSEAAKITVRYVEIMFQERKDILFSQKNERVNVEEGDEDIEEEKDEESGGDSESDRELWSQHVNWHLCIDYVSEIDIHIGDTHMQVYSSSITAVISM